MKLDIKGILLLAAIAGALAFFWLAPSDGLQAAPKAKMTTIDGEPIDYAAVTFMPTQGRASIGRTDADGVYKLAYVIGQDGALIGNHKVYVTTRVKKEPAYGQKEGVEKSPIRLNGRKELLPKENCDRNYTELTATVESGNNEINFDPTSKKKTKKK